MTTARPHRVGDCIYLTGSTNPDGTSGLPSLCIRRGCTGKRECAPAFSCYMPITDLYEEKEKVGEYKVG